MFGKDKIDSDKFKNQDPCAEGNSYFKPGKSIALGFEKWNPGLPATQKPYTMKVDERHKKPEGK